MGGYQKKLAPWAWVLLAAPPSASTETASLALLRPEDGGTVPPTFDFGIALDVADPKTFSRLHSEATVCMELDAEPRACFDILTSSLGASNLTVGEHRVSLWVQQGGYGVLVPPVRARFSVVSPEAWEAWVAAGAGADEEERAAMAREKLLVAPPLLAWHGQRLQRGGIGRVSGVEPSPRGGRQSPWACPVGGDVGGNGVELLIGIKTHALGFPARDALRRTWLGDAPSSVCAWFLLGTPVGTGASPAAAAALAAEAAEWGDLLVDELAPATDGYLDLVRKTKAFLHYASLGGGTRLGWAWVMLCDDDVLLRPAALVASLQTSAPRERFYAGQVWAAHFGHAVRPMRMAKHQNYLSPEEYPMESLPPFAIGPHYLLSRDAAAFVGRNRNELQGVGTLEDVSVALWLLALQVRCKMARCTGVRCKE